MCADTIYDGKVHLMREHFAHQLPALPDFLSWPLGYCPIGSLYTSRKLPILSLSLSSRSFKMVLKMSLSQASMMPLTNDM